MKNCFVYFCIIGTYILHYAFTPLAVGYFRWLTMLYGLMVIKLLLHLIVAHVTAQQFRSFRISILISCFLGLLSLIITRLIPIDESIILWPLILYNVVSKDSRIIFRLWALGGTCNHRDENYSWN